MANPDKLTQILSTVTLPDLCNRLGVSASIIHGRAIRSPLRSDSNPSFCVWNIDGKWVFKDYGAGTGGDVIDFYREFTGSSKPLLDLYDFWFGNSNPPAKMKDQTPEPKLPAIPLDWAERVSKLTDPMLDKLAEWRGYPREFCGWMRERRLIGAYGTGYCFPVFNRGYVVRFHVRWPTGMWTYEPKNIASELMPLVIGSGKCVHLGESQWDIFAVMSALPVEYVTDCTWIATRGSGNGCSIPPDYVWRQRDDTEAKQASEAKWASRFSGQSVWPPRTCKDPNDWLRSNPTHMRKQLASWFL